jgi:hypothetical protein
VGVKAATQRLAQLGELVAKAAPRKLGEGRWVALASQQCPSIARPEAPSTSEATEPSRIEASSNVLWMRWASAVWVWISRLR